MRKLENVVVGVDFSQHSEDALAQALRIARHDASELHVLHVVEDLVASDLAELFDVPEDEIRGEVLRNAQTHVEKIVSAARHKTAQVSGDDGFEANIHVDVIIGNPCVEILRCVRDVSADRPNPSDVPVRWQSSAFRGRRRKLC